MELPGDEISQIVKYLASEAAPRWMTASGLKNKLNLEAYEASDIDDFLNQYVSGNKPGIQIRRSNLPSRKGGLEILWGHLSKVNQREVSSIFREDNPSENQLGSRILADGRSPDLFFSHSFKDTDSVINLAKDLEDLDVISWVAEMDIQHGSRINHAVYSAIQSCRIFGVYLSQYSIFSTWTAKEIEIGLNSNKPVIGFLDISDQETIQDLEDALERNRHEVRTLIFDRFFRPNSQVLFFDTNQCEPKVISMGTIEIFIRDWNLLKEL